MPATAARNTVKQAVRAVAENMVIHRSGARNRVFTRSFGRMNREQGPGTLTTGPACAPERRDATPQVSLDDRVAVGPGGRHPAWRRSVVFTAPEGGAVRLSSWRSRFFLPATKAAGVRPFRVHDLRHTAVSLWIAAGASPNEVAARAGHSLVSVVLDRYGHLLPGSSERVNDALDRLATASTAHQPRSLSARRTSQPRWTLRK
jgi:hypothetical protein